MSELDRNINGFSYTEKLNEFIRNPDWQHGYQQVVDNEMVRTADGKVDFNNSSDYSTLWYTLSSAFEEVGNSSYTYIHDLQKSVRDIDYCTVHALNSIAKELNVEAIQIFDINYPLEIEKLINLLSIPRNKLLTSGAVISYDSIEAVYSDLGQNVSSVMDGYDMDTLSSYITTDQINETNTYISAGYDIIPASAWLNYIDTQVSTCLMTYVLLDGIINEFKLEYDNNPLNDPTVTPQDSEDIEKLKVTYGVSKSFHVKKEADNIINGISKLHNYLPNQRIVIQAEIDSRNTLEKFGSNSTQFSTYRYEKEKKVRQYVSFIENINVYNSDYTTYSDTLYSSGSSISFFSLDADSNPVSSTLIQNCTYILRNMILKTSYQRDYLKNIARKHAIVGTTKIIQSVISEYIARNFSSDRYWGYHTFEELSSPFTDISNLEVIDEQLSSNILGDIRVIEYYDTTNYMNLSAAYESPSTEDLVNSRFWEGEDAELNQLLSYHTSAEIYDFYKKLIPNVSNAYIDNLLSTIYNIGAVSASVSAEYGYFPYTVSPSGTFGDYGVYTFTASANELIISGDALAEYEYVSSPHYSSWIASPLISGIYPPAASADFLTAWLENDEVSAWVYGITIEADESSIELFIDNTEFEYENTDDVSAWIVNNFGITGYVENENTELWYESPLISRLSRDDFEQAWSEAPVISSWTSLAAITAPFTAPFNRLNWDSVPEILDLSGIYPTQTAWLSSDFVRTWTSAPFSVETIGIDFDQTVDWETSANPYVSGFLSAPFELRFINSGIISSHNVDNDTAATLLYEAGAIPQIKGGYDTALSGMYIKYSGAPSGTFVPANHRNTIHPSIAMQPYLYNLVEKFVDNVFFENIYTPFILELDELSSRINEDGIVIDNWRRSAIDFTGYRTYYEDSNNINLDFDEDERIDVDGPWIPTALKSFLDPISGDTSTFITQWYSHLGLATSDLDFISSQIEAYRSDIYDLSSKIIYNYAVDSYGNHYTLYKDEDTYDSFGSMWMRYKNHALSFPLASSTSYTMGQISYDDFSILSANFTKLTEERCRDFGIGSLGADDVIWMYGNDKYDGGNFNNVPANDLTQEQYNIVYHPLIKRIDNDQHYISFERWPNLSLFNRINQNSSTAKVYVGTYIHNDNLIIVKFRNLNSSQSINQAPTIFASVTGGDYTTYNATVEWNINNIYKGSSITLTNIRGLKYPEKPVDFTTEFVGVSGKPLHTPFKLVKGEDTVTIAYECISPSASISAPFTVYDYSQPYYTLYNECSGKFYDNGITMLDFSIGENTSIGDNNRDPQISYYYAYNDVTYQPINAYNGFAILSGLTDLYTLPTEYELLSGDDNVLKLQYFGKTGTSAIFGINDTLITCFNSVSGNFGISVALTVPTWTSDAISLSYWDMLSAFTWDSLVPLNHTFTYVNEVYPPTSAPNLLSGYSFTYNGPGCHLFEVTYNP